MVLIGVTSTVARFMSWIAVYRSSAMYVGKGKWRARCYKVIIENRNFLLRQFCRTLVWLTLIFAKNRVIRVFAALRSWQRVLNKHHIRVSVTTRHQSHEFLKYSLAQRWMAKNFTNRRNSVLLYAWILWHLRLKHLLKTPNKIFKIDFKQNYCSKIIRFYATVKSNNLNLRKQGTILPDCSSKLRYTAENVVNLPSFL